MALSRQRKAETVSEVKELLDSAMMTVVARYQGTSVKGMQELRLAAKEGGTKIRITKNRLVKKALESNQRLKDVDSDMLTGQLMYAFNQQDDAAPAQALADFAKLNPQIEFVGAITFNGEVLSAEDVSVLASLPTKNQLRASLAGTLNAPMSGLAGVLKSNIRSILTVLNARAETLGS